MDRDKMESGVRRFVEAIGQRFEGDDLEATPARVARAWCDDLLAGYGKDPQSELTWTDVEPGGGPVIVRGISFASVCVHHLLPFHGYADVAYLPDRRQAGLSKIGRVVDLHARRLQTQERLTGAIVESLFSGLRCRGVLARLQAVHTCMTLRGVRKEQSRMVTIAARGVFETDRDARREILDVLQAPADGGEAAE